MLLSHILRTVSFFRVSSWLGNCESFLLLRSRFYFDWSYFRSFEPEIYKTDTCYYSGFYSIFPIYFILASYFGLLMSVKLNLAYNNFWKSAKFTLIILFMFYTYSPILLSTNLSSTFYLWTICNLSNIS